MSRLVSLADLARLKGVSRPAVTQAVRRGTIPREGDRVNLDDPAVRAWLGDRWPKPRAGKGPDRGPPSVPRRAPLAAPSTDAEPTERRGTQEEQDEIPTVDDAIPRPAEGELDELAAQLRPILDKFGTSRNLRDWLLALKDIEVINEKQLKNEEAQGRLISRELVRAHVFGVLDAMNRRLLRDSPKTIARRLSGHFAAGGTIEDAERMVRENLTSQIKPVKVKVSRTLRGGSALAVNPDNDDGAIAVRIEDDDPDADA